MSFLLDTDIRSAHMRRPAQLARRFIQYTGRLAIPTIGLGELYAGAYKHPTPTKLLGLISDLLQEVSVLDFDAACAERFGRERGALRKRTVKPALRLLLLWGVGLVLPTPESAHGTSQGPRSRTHLEAAPSAPGRQRLVDLRVLRA